MASATVVSSFKPDKKHSDVERWICIYPAYVNSKKSLAEGRKIAKVFCVENPTSQEIRDVLQTTGLRVFMEEKIYPRERSKESMYKGRVRVEIKNDDGTPIKPELATREAVMKYVGQTIPKLKSRQSRYSDQGHGSHHSTSKGKGRKKRR